MCNCLDIFFSSAVKPTNGSEKCHINYVVIQVPGEV